MTQLARISKFVTGTLGDLISARPGIRTDPSPRVSAPGEPSPSLGLSNEFQTWFAHTRAPSVRLREMEYYDYLEREIADVRKALDAYATMAVTGNLAGGGLSTFTIRLLDDESSYPEPLLMRLKRMETMIQRISYSTVRTMTKFGSYMPEIIPDRLEDGRMGIRYIKPIPPGTVFRYLTKDGVTDPAKYWIQVINERVVGAEDAKDTDKAAIPQWRLPHFAIWSNVVSATNTILYGSSILQPFGSIGLKLHGTLDAMVLARLTRAAMRYVWMIDVSDIKDDGKAIQRRVSSWRSLLSRSETLINSNNAADSYKRPPTPDADFFVPGADGLSWGLDKIDGDMNLGRVSDVELLTRFYFGALGVPPEYMGHERSQGGRSNLSQIDIHFARTVRHIQMFGAAGFEHIVWVDMLLGGWDPREHRIEIVPPSIGARDDLLQAQIRALQSAVVAQLKAAGMRLDVNPRWILRTFLNMDEELEQLEEGEVEMLFEALDVGGSEEPPPGGKRQNVEAVLRNLHSMIGPIIRENMQLLAANRDPVAGLIHRHDQPSVEDLAAGLRGEK